MTQRQHKVTIRRRTPTPYRSPARPDHPVGTGIGAAAGGMAAGAAAGTVAGPVGTVVGAVIGAVVGGYAGKGVAELIDPTAEEAYWQDNYSTRPYVAEGSTFDDYAPAYRYGWTSYDKYRGRPFRRSGKRTKNGPRVEPSCVATSKLDWNRAKLATKDSWQRVSDASRARRAGRLGPRRQIAPSVELPAVAKARAPGLSRPRAFFYVRARARSQGRASARRVSAINPRVLTVPRTLMLQTDKLIT